jgi:hypothetical protein
MSLAPLLIYPAWWLIAFLLATWLIRRGIPCLRAGAALPDSSQGSPVIDFGAAGFWIGACEMILFFLFAAEGEYGALALVVGAKEVVRREKIATDASYYLLGTLANLTIALLGARFAALTIMFWVTVP